MAPTFTQGGTMRHVAIMTMTGAIGLTFLFLIDLATLFWVSRLGDEQLVAVLGFAWTIMFFVISVGIGLAIAAMALVSNSLGRGQGRAARRSASASLLIAGLVQVALCAAILLLRDELLAAAGATGRTAELTARFLAISLPSIPLMTCGLVGAAILRAMGDAWHSLAVSLAAGVAALLLDPLLIFGFGLGIEGAAVSTLISRSSVGILAVYYLWRVHRVLVPVGMRGLLHILRPFLAVALPAMAAQLSTPFGNYLLTTLIAQHGDGAVAGWAILNRLSALAFGGIYALSGSVGGILGQNYGAGLLWRVRAAYRDTLIFVTLYTGVTWAVLYLMQDRIIAFFRLGPNAAEVVAAFIGLAAGGFVFTGALFCANAAFNVLGKPLWATLCNWSRDVFVMVPVAWALSVSIGAPGVVYGQALAGVVVGTLSAWFGWRYIDRLDPARGVGAELSSAR